MTEAAIRVAVAKPVVTEEWRGAPRLPIDDSHVITMVLPLVVVLIIFVAALVSCALVGGGEDRSWWTTSRHN